MGGSRSTDFGVTPESGAIQGGNNRTASLPLPKKKRRPLLYVSGNVSVEVYDFLSGKRLGFASGLGSAAGFCSDKEGDAYVADFTRGTVVMFPYGSTKGRIVAKGLQEPVGCGVSESGDLAVSQYEAGRQGKGSVIVYKAGSKVRKKYNGPYIAWAPAFDRQGNLFVEGQLGSCGTGYCISELPAGGTSLATVTLEGATIGFPASVEFNDGKLEFGDQNYNGGHTTAIYTATCSGLICTVTATTNLTDNCFSHRSEKYNDVIQWAEYSREPNLQSGGKVTEVAGANQDCANRFDIWTFPGGGNPRRHIKGPNQSAGQTIVN